jgi:hypothetical protein
MAEDDVSIYTRRKKQESREDEEKRRMRKGRKRKRKESGGETTHIPLASVEFAHTVIEKGGLIGLRSARSRPFDSG